MAPAFEVSAVSPASREAICDAWLEKDGLDNRIRERNSETVSMGAIE